jgi:hypothetical protein
MIQRLGVLGVLVAVGLSLVRCENPPSSVADCHDIRAVNSGGFAASCPTGATQFCADIPIVATSPSQARGACDACFGPLACSLSLACGGGPDATSWEGPLIEPQRPTSYTVYQFASSGPVAAGEISSGRGSDPACRPNGRWAP